MFMPCVVWAKKEAEIWLAKTADSEIYKLTNNDDFVIGYTVLPKRWAQDIQNKKEPQ